MTKQKHIADIYGYNKNYKEKPQDRIAEWHPSSRSYRANWGRGFDLSTLSSGPNCAVDGRSLIETGQLARFARTLASLADTLSWRSLNRAIAERWGAIQNTTGTGAFTITLPKVSRTGNDVNIKLVLTHGSSLPFANRTLSYIAAYEVVERKPGWFTRLLRFLGVRRAA